MIQEQAKTDVHINGQQAGAELDTLAKKAEKLRQEMIKLRKANDKTGYDKKNKELKKTTKEMKELTKQTFDYQKVLKKIDGSSINDLTKAYSRLNRERKKMDPQSKEFKKATANAKKLRAKIDELNGSVKKTHSPLSKMKGFLLGLGAISTIKRLITNIIQVRSEFEKYQAVLNNALGSQIAANMAMKDLQSFAAKTPFQLNELTGAYVKLTNQGFKPTMKDLTKLGDLAATQGKEFDQLTEAIIDAQTGEFERLKEFGIRASKQGDQVSFTFRGVERQVAFTATSIQNYILGLGEMEGVTDSMAQISETLGGRISNLKDGWTNMMNAMGEQSSGVMVTAVNWMIDIVNTITEATVRMRRFKTEYFDVNLSERAQQSVALIDVMIESNLKRGQTESEAQADALEFYLFSYENHLQQKQSVLEKATKNREEWELSKFAPIEKARAIKIEARAAEDLRLFKAEKKAVFDHYIEVNELRLKKEEEYRVEKIKQDEAAEKEAEKERKMEFKKATEDLKILQQERENELSELRAQEAMTQEELEDALLIEKIANLNAEILLRQEFNEDYSDLEAELLQIQIDNINKLQTEKDKASDADKKRQEKDDKAAADQTKKDLADYERLVAKRVEAATGMGGDLVNAWLDTHNQQKQIEEDYNQAVADLKLEREKGLIDEKGFRDSMALLDEERRQEEVKMEGAKGRAVLLEILKYLRKFAHAKIAEATIASMASKGSLATLGIAGLAKAALFTALIEGAYGLAASKLTQHYDGRYPVVGASDNRKYMATPAGSATTGIYSQPSLVAERGDEMIIDNPTLNNISINRPDILGSIMAMRVPQYSEGRYMDIYDSKKVAMAAMIPYGMGQAEVNLAIVEELKKLREDLLAGNVKSVVDDYQVRALRNRSQQISDIENSVSG